MKHMDKDVIIWKNIERLSKERGWSLSELARQAKTRPSAINNIKTGQRGVGPTLLKRFADALGVPVEHLLKTDSSSLCPVNCDLQMMQLCQKMKEIRDSKSHWWSSLEQNINSFHKGMESDRGTTSGTQKPAGRTGLKKKAG